MSKNIIILYYSKSGNTELFAKRIFEIFRVFLLEKDINLEMMDAKEINYDKIKNADALIIGSPDYFSYPSGYIKIFFDEMRDFKKQIKDTPAFTFVTHGGGGKAAKYIDRLSKSIGLDLVSKCISVEEKDIGKKEEKKIKKALKEFNDILDLNLNL